MTNATMNELKNATANATTKTSKTVKTSKTTARKSKTDTQKKELIKTTNKKIENVKKVSPCRTTLF